MRLAVLTAVLALTLAGTATAAVRTVPMSDPHVAVSAGATLTTAFVNLDPGAQVVALNWNQNWTASVSDGSSCPSFNPRRGVVKLRCTLPAGGAVVYSGRTVGGTHTYTTASTATSPTVILGSVDYLTTSAPFVPTVYTITCDWKGWGYYVAPPGCPAVPA